MIQKNEFNEAKNAIEEEIAKINALKKIIDDSDEPKNIAQAILSYFTPILTSAPYAKYENNYRITYHDYMSDRTNSDVKSRLQQICNMMIHYYQDLYKRCRFKENLKSH